MKHRMSWILALTLAVSCTACSGKQVETENVIPMDGQTGSGQIPEELAQIPAEYFGTASEQGAVERLTYQTWESMSYEEQTMELTKMAYVYLPYGYSEEKQYNVLYLMHGGWENGADDCGMSNL